MAQFLWPGGFVVPKCSCYTVTTGFLGQTTQASMYQTFWGLEPLDQLRTFSRKMSKLYTLKCTHILTSMKIRICT